MKIEDINQPVPRFVWFAKSSKWLKWDAVKQEFESAAVNPDYQDVKPKPKRRRRK